MNLNQLLAQKPIKPEDFFRYIFTTNDDISALGSDILIRLENALPENLDCDIESVRSVIMTAPVNNSDDLPKRLAGFIRAAHSLERYKLIKLLFEILWTECVLLYPQKFTFDYIQNIGLSIQNFSRKIAHCIADCFSTGQDNPNVLAQWLKQQPDTTYQRDGRTLIEMAYQSHHAWELIQLFAANCNTTDGQSSGYSFVAYQAVKVGRTALAVELLQRGAKANYYSDVDNMYAIHHLAVSANVVALRDYLKQVPSALTLQIPGFIAQDTNFPTPKTQSPLIYAISKRYCLTGWYYGDNLITMLDCLSELSLDDDTKDKLQLTEALIEATHRKDNDLVIRLLRVGAIYPHKPNSGYGSTSYWAAHNEDCFLTNILICYGAPLDPCIMGSKNGLSLLCTNMSSQKLEQAMPTEKSLVKPADVLYGIGKNIEMVLKCGMPGWVPYFLGMVLPRVLSTFQKQMPNSRISLTPVKLYASLVRQLIEKGLYEDASFLLSNMRVEDITDEILDILGEAFLLILYKQKQHKLMGQLLEFGINLDDLGDRFIKELERNDSALLTNKALYEHRIFLEHLLDNKLVTNPKIVQQIKRSIELIDDGFETSALDYLSLCNKKLRKIKQVSSEQTTFIGNLSGALNKPDKKTKLSALIDALEKYSEVLSPTSFSQQPNSKINNFYFSLCWILSHSSNYPLICLLPQDIRDELLDMDISHIDFASIGMTPLSKELRPVSWACESRFFKVLHKDKTKENPHDLPQQYELDGRSVCYYIKAC